MTPPYVLGIDIGGTKIAVGVVAADGQLIEVQRVPTPVRQGAQAILQAVADLGHHLIERFVQLGGEIAAVGIGAGGQIEFPGGRVRYATDTIPGWAGTEIVEELQPRFGLRVVADNDVNVLALGEHRFGAAKDYDTVLFVAVGTGVGGGLIVDGELRRGNSCSAGDFAHLLVEAHGGRICNCGQRGHLEAYAAGPAISMRYCELTQREEICNLHFVAQQAEQGEQIAQQVIEDAARILGRTLIGAINLIDPQALVIGGGVMALGDRWWVPLCEELRNNPMPGPAQLPILPASLGISSAVVGAGALAFALIDEKHTYGK